MFNFFARRLLKRAGLSADDLRDLVERGTKEFDETDAMLRSFAEKGETIESAFEGLQADMQAALRKAKADAQQKQAEQEEKARNAAALDQMLHKMRPGMHIRAFDPIVDRFGAAYSPEALRNSDNWTGVIRGKCVIDYDDDGILTRVHFSGATEDTLRLASKRRLETVLATTIGIVLAEDLEVHDTSMSRAVELGSVNPNFEILAWFWSGRFHSTTYLTPAERVRMAKAIEAQRPPEPAKPEPPIHKTPEQIAADTELRRVYYAWADAHNDQTYRDLVEWIINQTSPDARHSLIGINWDVGLAIPFWIIRQPGTYLATALKAFEMGEAPYHLAEPKRNSPGSEFAYELNQRIRDGFYVTPEGEKSVAYTPTLRLDRYPAEKADALRKIVAPAVFEPLEGRADHRVFGEMPEQFIDYLN